MGESLGPGEHEQIRPSSDAPGEYAPQVVSRESYTEGGYTLLKRALATALANPRGQVIIDTGGLKLTYVHRPENVTFMDGISSIDGDSPRALEAFRGVASTYDVQQGLAELEAEGPRQ